MSDNIFSLQKRTSSARRYKETYTVRSHKAAIGQSFEFGSISNEFRFDPHFELEI